MTSIIASHSSESIVLPTELPDPKDGNLEELLHKSSESMKQSKKKNVMIVGYRPRFHRRGNIV